MAEAKIVLSAEDKTRAAFASAKSGLSEVSSLAAAAGFSLAALGSAATIGGLVAMVKQIANSVDEFNDLKDATGSSIENISALDSVARRTGGNFDTVSTSLIKFNMALGQTQKPGSEAEKVIKAIGLNAKQLRDMDPAEALLKTAVALQGFADDGNKARAVQELFGKSLKEVAPFLKDLAEKGELNATVTTKQAEEAEKFNKELYKMSAAAQDAGRYIAGPLISSVNDLIERFRLGQKEGDGFVTTLLKFGAGGPASMAAKGIEEVARALFGLGTGTGPSNGYTDARKGIDNINQALKDTSLLEGERNALLAERVRLQAKLSGYLNSGAGAGRGMGGYENVPRGSLVLRDDPKKIAASTKATKTLSEAEKELNAIVAQGRKDFLARHDEQTKARSEEEKAIAQIRKSWFDMEAARQDADRESLVAIETRVAALDTEMANYGKLQSAIEQVKLARLVEAREGLYLAGENIEAINREIDARQRLVAGLQGQELRDANETAAKDAASSWKQVSDSFVDNLMRGGKSAMQYLKDLARTTVLRPLLQPVGNMMAGAVNGMMGGGGGGMGIGDLASGAGWASTAGSAFMTGMSGATAAMGGATTFGTVGAIAGNAAAIGTGATGVAGATGSMMAGASTALAAIPVAGWIALAAIALYSAFGNKGGGPKTEGGYAPGGLSVGGVDIGGNMQGSQRGDVAQAQTISQGISGSYAALATELGLVNKKLDVGVFYAMDNHEGGDSLTQLQVTSSSGYNRGTRAGGIENVARGEDGLKAALAEETIRVMIDGLKGSDLGQQFKDVFNALSADAGLTEMEAALKRVTTARQQQLTLEDTLFQLTATDLQKLNKARDAERAAIDPLNAVLLEQVYAQMDLQAAAEETTLAMEAQTRATEEAAQALADATDNTFAALERAVSAEKRLLDAQRQVAQQQVGSLSQLFELLQSNVRELYGQVGASAAMGAAQGSRFISQALAAARSTGYLPESAALSQAIGAARGGIDAGSFGGNQKDFEFAKLVLAGQLSQLADLTGPQLTAAEQTLANSEQQIERLDQLLIEERLMVDAARGIDTSVQSVADAVLALRNALVKEQPGAAKPGSSAGGAAGSFTTGAGGSAGGGTGSQMDWADFQGYFSTYGGGESGPARMAWYLKFYGQTQQSAADALGLDLGLVQAYFDRGGIPAFRSGGNHAGGWAMVGEGGPELVNLPPSRIYNAADTQRMVGGLGGSAVEGLLRSILARLDQLEANTGAGAIHSFNGAKAVQEMLDRGVPIDQTRTGAITVVTA